MQEAIPRRLLHDHAVDRLRDLIIAGTLPAASRLNERVLCEQLGISRTPLREAIKRLSAEGLVELMPNRGAMVSPISAELLRHTFAVMVALEALAGELACAEASDAQLAEIRALHYEMLAHHARGDLPGYFAGNQQIHLKLVEASRNPVLAQTYRALNAHVRRARLMANVTQARWDAAVHEHEEMLAALVKRDAPRLKAILSQHLDNTMTVALDAASNPSS